MWRSLLVKVPTVALAILAELWLPSPLSHVALGVVLSVGLAVMSWFLFHPNASLWAKVVSRGRSGVAITFDDGPDPIVTPLVLDLLAHRGVKATFFVIGEKAELHPETLRRIVREGHEIGSHAYTHTPSFHFRLWRGVRDDLARAARVIEEATGTAPRLFRSPYGIKNPALGDVVRELGLVHVGWSASAHDGIGATRDEIVHRIAPRLEDGAIVLLHDGKDAVGRGDRRETLAALDRILDEIAARGLSVVPLGEALGLAERAAPRE